MKIVLSLAVTIIVIAALLIKPLKKYRWKIMAGYALAVAGLFLFYNVRTKDLILPFYKPTNQMFYQPEYTKTSEYPDALLPYLLEGKKVILPSFFAWDPSIKETYEHWQSGGMLNMNMENVLIENGASVELKDYSTFIDADKYESDMLALGYFNDTFRYSYFYNDMTSEYGNGFYYYWFYGANAIPFKLIICPVGFEESDVLYAMLDKDSNFYLIPEKYYEEVTKNV